MATPPRSPRPPRVSPLRVVVRPLQAFFQLEAASGIVLFACAVGALAWVNLGGGDAYRAIFGLELSVGAGAAAARFTLLSLVNDGLMTIFFFVVGMEVKRELVIGELRTPARALLPAIAAVGGMVVPAALYHALNRGGEGAAGWGIPMATDIAFCIGCLRLLRRRVPHALLVFVTALAIFDDIGGILVIAIFYGSGLHGAWLGAAAAIGVALAVLSRLRVGSGVAYALAGAALWYALHHAGIHATIAGVAVGLAVPARMARDAGPELEPPLDRFVHALHPWVAFGVMPLFALANSGVDLSSLEASQLTGPIALGTGLGLFAGKQAGIFAFAFAATRLGVSPVPGGASTLKLLGVSIVAGIGFTVALFIANLAFPGAPALLDEAKFGIIAGSLASGLVGCVLLAFTPPVDAAEGEGTPRPEAA
jgi:NhaA family Na+:H+ antiporter